MLAAVCPGVGQAWELREVSTPVAGPGEVLIRVHASGICHNDVWVTDGTLPYPPIEPTIVGHEPAGEVVEVGAGVTARKVGDRVGATWIQAGCGSCDYCARNLPLTGVTGLNCTAPAMTGLTRPGGHAEYLAVPAASTVLLPDALSYQAAAPLLCAGYTSWSALRAGDPKPHERVAVLGIGGLGHLAVQFSKACGLETVAVTSSPDKHELARDLGADQVVADGSELAAIGGADVIVVTGPSYQAASESLAGLRVNGRLVLAGIDPIGILHDRPVAAVLRQGADGSRRHPQRPALPGRGARPGRPQRHHADDRGLPEGAGHRRGRAGGLRPGPIPGRGQLLTDRRSDGQFVQPSASPAMAGRWAVVSSSTIR